MHMCGWGGGGGRAEMITVSDFRYPELTFIYSIGKSFKKHEMNVLVISDNPSLHEKGRKLQRKHPKNYTLFSKYSNSN